MPDGGRLRRFNPGLDRELGAYLALLASAAAAVPVAMPIVRSQPGRH
jgi:hypothetical protein